LNFSGSKCSSIRPNSGLYKNIGDNDAIQLMMMMNRVSPYLGVFPVASGDTSLMCVCSHFWNQRCNISWFRHCILLHAYER